ncbi:MAG: 2-oxoacid:acceptor oxidoreductase subunit alpha [Candidatus Margulisbacteria bacterium]|jgi:2-oxoglutarate ferredoxin oxidoreductase subunit alpha|nr:2-oxoacid:acceptor oxidoreductase subunit alpha [Candidatus Margulisiibacteriota bacterium]
MKNELSIVICGEAGQGIQTLETVLVKLVKKAGYNVFATKEYMSRVRGGVNSTSLRISARPVDAYVERIDLLFQLGLDLTKHLRRRIGPLTRVLTEIGNNMTAVGVVAGILGLDRSVVEEFVSQYFQAKGPEVIGNNLAALRKGYEERLDLGIKIVTDPLVKEQIMVNGAEAVALGALAGGCNFIAAYPMTPSTGIFTFLAQQAAAFGLVAEQAEDEIAAINMALGAWYAGARAIVPTSGGGFALMVEGLSLAGMLETPVVISLGMRPGPATGLPTRTEQGDLNFALYAGHGEFPRIILAPGTLAEAFELSARAFNLADQYQVPVIVLTDQYFVDSYYNTGRFAPAKVAAAPAIVKTEADYRRYQLTKDGISPRGIPGYGDGLVGVDSDEHDEAGHITEDLTDVRPRMVEKRVKKLAALQKAAISPTLIGRRDYKTLVVCWGSTRNAVAEALGALKKRDVACLHFSQVYPLHRKSAEYLKKAKKLISVENNATGQFAALVKRETGFEFDRQVNKYDGLPFSVEELVEALNG